MFNEGSAYDLNLIPQLEIKKPFSEPMSMEQDDATNFKMLSKVCELFKCTDQKTYQIPKQYLYKTVNTNAMRKREQAKVKTTHD